MESSVHRFALWYFSKILVEESLGIFNVNEAHITGLCFFWTTSEHILNYFLHLNSQFYSLFLVNKKELFKLAKGELSEESQLHTWLQTRKKSCEQTSVHKSQRAKPIGEKRGNKVEETRTKEQKGATDDI